MLRSNMRYIWTLVIVAAAAVPLLHGADEPAIATSESAPSPEQRWWCADEPHETWGIRICRDTRDACLSATLVTDCHWQRTAWCMVKDNTLVPGRSPVCAASLEECRHNRAKVPPEDNPSSCYPSR